MVSISHIVAFPNRFFQQSEQIAEKETAPTSSQAIQSAQRAKIDVTNQNGPLSVGIVRINGCLDVHSYKDLINKVGQAHKDGISNAVVDLSKVTKIELSGQFALHHIAALFHGHALPDPENGIRELRRLVERNVEAGALDQVSIVCNDEQLRAGLKKIGLDAVFPCFNDLDAALQAFPESP